MLWSPPASYLVRVQRSSHHTSEDCLLLGIMGGVRPLRRGQPIELSRSGVVLPCQAKRMRRPGLAWQRELPRSAAGTGARAGAGLTSRQARRVDLAHNSPQPWSKYSSTEVGICCPRSTDHIELLAAVAEARELRGGDRRARSSRFLRPRSHRGAEPAACRTG
jgi:hypothetical protein